MARFDTALGNSKKLVDAGEWFVALRQAADPSANVVTDVAMDTNVALETVSFGDLLREGQRCQTPAGARRSAMFRYRQERARASILLMWVLAKRGLVVGMLGREMFDLLEKISPTPAARDAMVGARDGTSYAFTAGVVAVIHPMLVARGLKLGALTEVDHRARGEAADTELLEIAARDGLPLITNEGYTIRGVSDRKSDGSPSLRGRCRDRGVAVYNPAEYLGHLGVNVADEADEFLTACQRPVIDAYLTAGGFMGKVRANARQLDRDYDNDGWLAVLEDLIPMYRMILLDDVAEDVELITPPTLPVR